MAKRSGRKEPNGSAALERARARLYAIAPTSFTHERNALARQLADEGHKAEAARLKKLRRPAASVWAVNALAHVDPAAMKRLLDAGKELRLAQRKALSGVGADKLRAASGRLRDEVEAALGEVKALLLEAEESHSQSVLERAQQTLLAAAQGNEELREALRAGRLDEDLSPAGFGDVTGLWQVPSVDRPAPAAKQQKDKKRPTTKATSAKQAEQDRKRLAREQQQEERVRRAALKSQLDAAKRDADRRHKALERARTKLERSQAAAQEAEARARQIRARCEEAAREFTAAEAADASARSALASAKAALRRDGTTQQ